METLGPLLLLLVSQVSALDLLVRTWPRISLRRMLVQLKTW